MSKAAISCMLALLSVLSEAEAWSAPVVSRRRWSPAALPCTDSWKHHVKPLVRRCVAPAENAPEVILDVDINEAPEVTEPDVSPLDKSEVGFEFVFSF